MKKLNNIISFCLLLIICTFHPIRLVKPGPNPNSKSQIEIGNNKINEEAFVKKCQFKEKCRECTFDELKATKECQETGYKLLRHCLFYNDLGILKDEHYYVESCYDKLINRTYLLLIITIITGVLCLYMRNLRKRKLFFKTIEKLTMGKDK